MLSDTDSSDSDNGIRFKTASTRNKDDSYTGSAPSKTSASSSNGQRRSYDDYRSSRDDRSDVRDRRSHNDQRHSRRSESRERKHRSTSRERHLNSRRSSERRSSRSRDQIRDTDKKQPIHRSDHREVSKPISSRSRSVEKIIQVELEADKTLDKDKHKAKKTKSKKHKRSKRSSDNSKERIKSLDVDIETSTTIQAETVGPKLQDKIPIEDLGTDTKSSTEPRRCSISIEENSSNSICGPKLPPHLKHSRSRSAERNPSSSSHRHRSRELINGPSLPPPSASSSTSSSSHSTRRNEEELQARPRTLGPAAPPPQFRNHHHEPDTAMSDISESEDDDLIGPLPDGVAHKSEAHLELEKRALELKLAKFSENDALSDLTVRDEWMLELPEVRGVTDMGLTARQFRTKERPDLSDRSGWTDTPQERERKQQHHPREPTAEEVRATKQKDAKAIFNSKRDDEQEAAARKHRKKHKRDESLIDIHVKKLKKKKQVTRKLAVFFNESHKYMFFFSYFQKEEDVQTTRRPFSRDSDLKVNRFDQAQKNAILKKAQLLDTRFSRGETKYL